MTDDRKYPFMRMAYECRDGQLFIEEVDAARHEQQLLDLEAEAEQRERERKIVYTRSITASGGLRRKRATCKDKPTLERYVKTWLSEWYGYEPHHEGITKDGDDYSVVLVRWTRP